MADVIGALISIRGWTPCTISLIKTNWLWDQEGFAHPWSDKYTLQSVIA